MVTLLPFTTSPLLLEFWVQHTPLPWSARQSQKLSPITLLALMTTQFVVLPENSPPTRLQISYRQIGSAERSTVSVEVPTCNNVGEAVGPASKMMPITFTPFTLETTIVGNPLLGISVGKPSPITIVSG